VRGRNIRPEGASRAGEVRERIEGERGGLSERVNQ